MLGHGASKEDVLVAEVLLGLQHPRSEASVLCLLVFDVSQTSAGVHACLLLLTAVLAR